jgi:hypothetical protein
VRGLHRLSLRLGLGLLVGAAALELAFRLRPELLPRAYRERFPMHGVELFHPGILERTPIEGLPLPIVVGPYSGPSPADLKELGVAPPEEDADQRAFPRISIPVDARGFPNAHEIERADVVLVGDSFAVAAGAVQPRGLAAELARVTGLTVFNLGVSAVGPVQEEWLLGEVGFAKEPRAVVWLFYAGNDVNGVLQPNLYKKQGKTTWAAAYADRRVPRWITLDLARMLLAPRPAPARAPLEGFRLVRADGTEQRLWFEPGELLQLTWTREAWEKGLAWRTTRDVLERVRARCAERGVRFLLVYLPSKPEVYLPYVKEDAALALETASWILERPPAEEAQAFLSDALAHRGDLERVVEAWCAGAGVPYLSGTVFLEDLAERGELGYLATDTHWQMRGQDALLAPLVDLLRAQGIAGK